MTLRQATPEDGPTIARLVLAFIASGPYLDCLRSATPTSVQTVIDLVFSLGDDGVVLLVEDDTGYAFAFLAAVVVSHPVTGERYCDELAWFVEPHFRGASRAGIQLLNEVKEFARCRGAVFLKMVSPFGSKVGEFYERLGFTPLETSYTIAVK